MNTEETDLKENIKSENTSDNLNKDFELAHCIGLNTSVKEPVQSHPSMNETILFSIGGIIITEDLTEKNNQVFFRHNKNAISCFKISNTGRYLAVGFTSGTHLLDKNLPVSIIVWDYERKHILYELTGIKKSVNILEFSQDDKFLAAAGADNYVYIWEVETAHKCFSRVYEYETTLIFWTTISFQHNKSKPDYTITMANIQGLTYLHLFFELKSMQYNMNVSKFTLPSTGFVRNYTCGLYDEKTNTVIFGTTGGEMVIFGLDKLFFKSSFNVSNNGMTCMVFSELSIIVGGGDGRVRKLINTNGKFTVTNEVKLNGKILSLALLADGKEIICSTSFGYIYRILVSDLTFTIHSYSATAGVNSIAFPSNTNDKIFTVDDNCNICLWDLNDFNLLNILTEDSAAKSISIADDESLFVGFANGFIKNYSLIENNQMKKNFQFPAHRGSVNTVYVDSNYLLSGGEDGIVRIWTRKSLELTIQFPAHHKDVFTVMPDINKPNLIYSCGGDHSLNTFDIKLQKRVNLHNIKNGTIRGIVQKMDGENEISKTYCNLLSFLWSELQFKNLGFLSN
jgi:WD40 repeat protein